MPSQTSASFSSSFKPQQQAADFFPRRRFARCLHVSAGAQRLEQDLRDALHFRGSRRSVLARGRAFASPRTSSYRHTATACPRFIEMCSSRVGIRISQWQWLKSSLDNPNFSEPNSNATGAAATPCAHHLRALLQPAKRMLQLALAHRGGAYNQAAVSNGFGHRAEHLRIQQHLRGANRGARTKVGRLPRSHQPKIANRSYSSHALPRRCSADCASAPALRAIDRTMASRPAAQASLSTRASLGCSGNKRL